MEKSYLVMHFQYRTMKIKQLTILLILVLISPLFLNSSLTVKATESQTSPSLYVGIDVAFESVVATEQLIDKVSNYTNIFVIGCSGFYNETRLTVISQYVYDKGMSFIVYTDSHRYPSQQWLGSANTKWGNSFLGIYYFDEQGGKQLDQNPPTVRAASNYSDAANQYVNITNLWLRGAHSITKSFAYPTQYQLFTSDYAFYWYDYEAGYDTVFAEFTMNYSQQLNVALCRGAATVLNKDWGVMITWKYTQPPYMESGTDLFNDMKLAYQNGAKYIIVFDSNEDYSQNVLNQTQLDAMSQFWQYVKDTPRTFTPVNERTAYVLPADYAYGFRGPYDRIWGLWPNDSITTNICMNVYTLLQTEDLNLDIVYPNEPRTVESVGYSNISYWNDTLLSGSATPSQDPATSAPKSLSLLEVYFLALASGIVAFVAVAATFTKVRNKRSNRLNLTEFTIK